MLSNINSVSNPSFGQVTCIKMPRKVVKAKCDGPKALAEKVSAAFDKVAPDLKKTVLIERHNFPNYYCPNITNIPMTMRDDDINICVLTGEEHDAYVNMDSDEFADKVAKEFEEKYGVEPLKQDSIIPLLDSEKKISTFDAINNIISSKFRALLNLEGKEVPVIKLNSFDDITKELAEKIR